MTSKKLRKHSLLKTTNTIKKKLEGLKSLTIDRLGYEKKIKINVLRFFTLAAKAEQLAVHGMKIHLYVVDDQVIGLFCSDSAVVRQLTRKEISELFLGQSSYSIWILAKIKRCLTKLAMLNDMSLDHLLVSLEISNCDPTLDLYDKDVFLKSMTIKELIKFFKA